MNTEEKLKKVERELNGIQRSQIFLYAAICIVFFVLGARLCS
jgi:hypothetical protein